LASEKPAKVTKPKLGCKSKKEKNKAGPRKAVQSSTRTLRSAKGKKLVGGLPEGMRI